MLLNQLMYSVYLVLSKSLSRHYSSVTMMKWMFLFSALVLAPFCFPHVQHVPIFHRETFNMTQLCALFYLLFGATFVAFMIIPMALKHIRPTTVSMYNYVQPLLSNFFLKNKGDQNPLALISFYSYKTYAKFIDS